MGFNDQEDALSPGTQSLEGKGGDVSHGSFNDDECALPISEKQEVNGTDKDPTSDFNDDARVTMTGNQTMSQ